MRKMVLLGTVATCLALAAGCGSSPQKSGGDAAPAGAPAASASPSTPGPAASQPANSTPSAAGSTNASTVPSVVGPTGFGALKLGMSEQQAEATALVKPFKAEQLSDQCTRSSNLLGAPSGQGRVLLNKNLGVATIDVYPGVRTAEGLTFGDSLASAQRIYPNAVVDWAGLGRPNRTVGHNLVPVPGNSQAYYRIDISAAGTVSSITLQLINQGCYE